MIPHNNGKTIVFYGVATAGHIPIPYVMEFWYKTFADYAREN
jgi:hypothetical protein